MHFPADSVAGMVLAQALSDFYVARFSGLGTPTSRTFDGRGFEGDFLFGSVLGKKYRRKTPINGNDLIVQAEEQPLKEIDHSLLLGYAWKQAVSEVRLRVGMAE